MRILIISTVFVAFLSPFSSGGRPWRTPDDVRNNFFREKQSIIDDPTVGRSGGQPKFPIAALSPIRNEHNEDDDTDPPCGVRIIPDTAAELPGRWGRLVGGSEANYGAFPWQVLIEAYRPELGGWHHHCSAVLVSRQIVLTAAHCVSAFPPHHFRVRLGKHNLHSTDSYEQTFAIEHPVVHHGYQSGQYVNDIAMVRLKSNDSGAKLGSHIRTICLPSRSLDASRLACSISGWGNTIPGVTSLSSVLQTARVPILEEDDCKRAYPSKGMEVKPGMLCAGYSKRSVDSCQGDSGGPLGCRINGHHVLVGLVSWGNKCGTGPGVYVKIGHYIDWINEWMQKL